MTERSSKESFKAGDRVRVVSDLANPFAGSEGVIHEVQPNDRGSSPWTVTSLNSHTGKGIRSTARNCAMSGGPNSDIELD